MLYREGQSPGTYSALMQASTFTDDKSYRSHNIVGPRAPNNPTIKNKLFVKRKSRKDTKKFKYIGLVWKLPQYGMIQS